MKGIGCIKLKAIYKKVLRKIVAARRKQPKEWTRPSEDEWAQWLATGDAEFIEYG